MIQINRSEAVPRRLEVLGKARTDKDCIDFDGDPEAYLAGTKKFSIIKSIYGTAAIKRKLLEAQHDKCCYCESEFLETGHGDVEHFRPKGSVRQDNNSRVEKPGYYWLGYSWSNLLVSCARCNTSHKGIRFPLQNPDRRARNHNDAIDNEEPMLVDPGAEDPRDHIRFRYDAPLPRTPRGEETICVLGLERHQLVKARLKWAKIIRMAYQTMNDLKQGQGHQEHIDELALFVQNSVNPSEKFSSMAIDLLDLLRSRGGEKA